MAAFVHPETLNPLQRYAQARATLRHTTRAINPAWYQEALELEYQLHIRTDGASVVCYFFNKTNSSWAPGPSLPESSLRDPAKIETAAAEIFRLAQEAKASALGVILHLADEFATTELKPELDNPAALGDLRYAAAKDPGSILDDASIPADQNSWRILPYPAQGSPVIGTVVTVTRQYAPFLEKLRHAGETHNFPIITHAVSAPLVVVMGLPEHLPLKPGKSFVAILQYPWLTTLAFFNEHGDLRLIRTLQHRHVRRAPNLGHAVATTNASLEFIDPDIFILPLAQETTLGVQDELTWALPGSTVTTLEIKPPANVPAWCIEPVIAATTPIRDGASTSHTFAILRNESWSLQDFLPTPPEIVERFPNRAEMKLLRVFKLARIFLFGIAFLIIGWLSLEMVNIVKHEEWSFNPSEAGAVTQRLNKLTKERQRGDYWDTMLEDRSRAWATMELFSRLFPERSGVLVKNFNYTVRPDQTPGKAKIGFVKEWKITGFSRDEAQDRLNELNTQEGISARFAEIASLTGNTAFDPSVGTRSLNANVRLQENSAFKLLPAEDTFDADPSSYPMAFDLTITQRFESADPLAINVTKAP